MNRRLFLKGALATSATITAISAGLLAPSMAFAGIPEFDKAAAAVNASMSGASAGNFKFKAPKIAENGAVVPIEINATKITGVTSIAIYVKNNTTPLASMFNLTGASVGFVSTRIKMGKSSSITAIVVAGGKTSTITKDVKVTVGGCGG